MEPIPVAEIEAEFGACSHRQDTPTHLADERLSRWCVEIADRVLRRMAKRFPNPQDAQDALQEVYLRLLRQGQRGTGARFETRDDFERYVKRSMKRLAIDFSDKHAADGRRRTGWVANREESGEPADPDGGHEPRAALISKYLHRLPTSERRVIRLCDLNGITQREAALEMGISAATVNRLRVAALVRLKTAMVNDGVDPNDLP